MKKLTILFLFVLNVFLIGNFSTTNISNDAQTSKLRSIVKPFNIEESEIQVYTDTYISTNMTMEFKIYELGKARYKFSISAKWNNMPDQRLKDSLGVSADGLSVDHSTVVSKCYYSRKIVYCGFINNIETISPSLTDYAYPATGDWNGTAVLFDLPDNGGNWFKKITYSNYYIYLEFEAEVKNPTLDLVFNSVATYSHLTKKTTVQPSISISSGGLAGEIAYETSTDCINTSMVTKELIRYTA